MIWFVLPLIFLASAWFGGELKKYPRPVILTLILGVVGELAGFLMSGLISPPDRDHSQVGIIIGGFLLMAVSAFCLRMRLKK